MNNKYLLGIILTVIIVTAGFLLYPKVFKHENLQVNADSAAEHKEYYTCPMHPSVRSDKPGACPVCGMALVKKTAMKEVPEDEVLMLQRVSLSPSQRVIANVATTTVEYTSMQSEVRTVGKIDYAEPNFRHISMRFSGRLEKLYLSYTGVHVHKGDPVADVYSPEAISAQQEYLLAKNSYEQVKESPELILSGAAELFQQSKQKLLLWGFSEQQIDNLDSTNAVSNIVTISSPISGTVLKKNVDPQHYVNTGEDIYDIADLSTVWMYADVYEKDLFHIKTGQSVTMTSESYPRELFKGTVIFIDPVVNPETRTVRVRAEFSNASGKLKPEMYVKAQILVPGERLLVVPNSAILHTGNHDIVWIEVSENTFEPREVTLGNSNETQTQILDGLEEGASVVTSGGYLLESESQLQLPSSAASGNRHEETGHTEAHDME